MQVVAIKAELLTPVLKTETALCVATDRRHNEPQSEPCLYPTPCFSFSSEWWQLAEIPLYAWCDPEITQEYLIKSPTL